MDLYRTDDGKSDALFTSIEIKLVVRYVKRVVPTFFMFRRITDLRALVIFIPSEEVCECFTKIRERLLVSILRTLVDPRELFSFYLVKCFLTLFAVGLSPAWYSFCHSTRPQLYENLATPAALAIALACFSVGSSAMTWLSITKFLFLQEPP